MKIVLSKVSKRYTLEWVIANFSHTFESLSCTGINGINGSGKSTLTKIICGQLSPSKGVVSYFVSQKQTSRQDIYKHIGLVAPYTDLVQDYTVKEMFDFHSKFKKVNISFEEFIIDLDFSKHTSKRIGEYSSGMKQKLQLGLAMYSEGELLLLDEPTSYLDDINKEWFAVRLHKILGKKTIIIASNDDFDFQFCKEVISI